ncbi:MAG: YihY/virulence factor BrkB family protein [Chloroflexota bacterium]|nr:YihY/virulence factor BrkB family protein [Chloroflexota bacterium]
MAQENNTQKLAEQFEELYEEANARSGGVAGILRRTVEQVSEKRAAQSAASISYYTLFSLFPLMLFLVFLASLFVDVNQAQAFFVEIMFLVLPDALGIQDMVVNTIERAFTVRGEIGIISVLGLLWASSAAFSTLTLSIGAAWDYEPLRSPIQHRLLGIAMIIILGVALITTLVASTVIGVLEALDIPLVSELWNGGTLLGASYPRVVTLAVSFLVFLALYHWIPRAHVPWRAAAIAAGLAALAWQVLSVGFSWYLSSGLARYELVYGSLTTVVVVMFWVYLSMLIILVGAHLSAAISLHLRSKWWRSAREKLITDQQ